MQVEFAATFLLVFFGLGGSAESMLSANDSDSAFSSHVTWGLSFMFAVYVSASVSGGTPLLLCIPTLCDVLLDTGHLNPAVTFTMCVHKRFQWRYLPGMPAIHYSVL